LEPSSNGSKQIQISSTFLFSLSLFLFHFPSYTTPAILLLIFLFLTSSHLQPSLAHGHDAEPKSKIRTNIRNCGRR
jgi:hypothetical protein